MLFLGGSVSVTVSPSTLTETEGRTFQYSSDCLSQVPGTLSSSRPSMRETVASAAGLSWYSAPGTDWKIVMRSESALPGLIPATARDRANTPTMAR